MQKTFRLEHDSKVHAALRKGKLENLESFLNFGFRF